MKTHVINTEVIPVLESATNQPGVIQSIATSDLPTGPQAKNGVWVAGPDDVFVAADRGRILHYDGVTWRLTDTGIPADLFAIWGRSRNEVYAVGWMGEFLQFDGSRWTRMAAKLAATIR